MARRRVRPPGTQLLRAGERTHILNADKPVPEVRFRATVLDGVPRGRITVDRVDGPETQELVDEVWIDGTGLVAVSVVPETDTAITFLPVERPSSPAFFLLGGVLFLGAIGWTFWELVGGG